MFTWLLLIALIWPSLSSSKLGPHLIGRYTPGGRQVVAAGPRVIKVLDPQANGEMRAAMRAYKRLHPAGVVVMRVWERTGEARYGLEDDPAASADDFWLRVLAPALARLAAQDRTLVDLLEGPNEGENTPTWGSVEQAAWFGRFWVRLAERIAQAGVRPCVGSVPVGNPPGTLEDIHARIEAFAPALRAARQHRGAFSYHAYSLEYTTDPGTEAWTSLRYRIFYDHLRNRHADLARLPLILTEAGIDRSGNPREDGWRARGRAEEYRRWLRWFDEELQKDPYVLGATLFQIGDPEGWWSFDLEPIAGWLAEHLRTQKAGDRGTGILSSQ